MASVSQESIYSSQSGPAPGNETIRWRRGVSSRDRARLNEAEGDPTAIVEDIPLENASLGPYDVSNLIFNRMIGSGVFNSSAVIYSSTNSVGISALLWLLGASVALSGVVVYIELGLTVPRYQIGDSKEKQSVPRSGGELPYLNYFFKTPKFLATCLFGISFIAFGNTAVNSIAFGIGVLEAANVTKNKGAIVGIALAANTFACMLHSMSRKWGITLNNFLGTAKLAMLLVVVIFGFIGLARHRPVAAENLEPSKAFASPAAPIYSYAEAAIFAIFPFGGFHQANYVLAEIRQPRRNFALVSLLSVSLICCLHVTINVLYAAVIPKEELLAGTDLSNKFFTYTIGSFLDMREKENQTKIKILGGFIRALSALGNVIVFTFTAARVKQEVAKEGVIPFSLFFASSYSFSLRPGRFGFRRVPQTRESYQLHSSRSPAAALLLHWTATSILIIAAVSAHGDERDAKFPAYYLLTAAYAYSLDIFWFSVIGVAMLYLRLWPGSTWRNKSPVPHFIGIVAAIIFAAGNLFPLIAIWIPNPNVPYMSQAQSQDWVPWFASQTTVFSVLGAGVLYWAGFRLYLYWRKSVRGEVFQIDRTPIFETSEEGGESDDGGSRRPLLLLVYEIISFHWVGYKKGDAREPEQLELTIPATEEARMSGAVLQPLRINE